MKDIRELEQSWNHVDMPVLVLTPAEAGAAGQQKTGGAGYVPVYENDAARALCPGGTLWDMLEQGLRETIAAGARELPPFNILGGRAYSALTFDWEGWRVCMFHDVNSYYEENQRVISEAVMANRAKTSFLSEMSHDIRTPMGAIMGMTDIALKQKDIPERVSECLGKIKVASVHMMSLLNEVLDMSRIESGRILLQKEDVDIADILHEILVVARSQADSGKLQFQLEIGRMDRERILADGVRLKQICLNLLSNAIKFTPVGGKVSLSLEIRSLKKPGRVLLMMRVQDTGIGMSPEFLNKVFVPFEREQKSSVNKIQGTGLGMAITKNLVDLMEGSITVESRLGEGSCFHVEIPFEAAEENETVYSQALSGRRVMLLDEDEKQADQVRKMLGNLHMEMDWAPSAEAAVDLLNDTVFTGREYFALLTVDRLSEDEVLLFLPQVRQRMGADFPILLLSGGDWSQTEYMYTRAGVDAFLPLPLFHSRLAAGLYAFTQEGKNRRQQEENGTQWNFQGRRILLVEDNEINREIAQELLGMANLEIECREDGAQALERFREMPPGYYDMILMDIQMPVMNGLDATRAIRALEREDARRIPIVAMTANAFVEDVKNSLDAGMNAHISKPLDMNQVYSTIELFLGRTEA